jgi:hypothetical protein
VTGSTRKEVEEIKMSIVQELLKNSSLKDIKRQFDWASLTGTSGEQMEKQLDIRLTMNRALEKIFEVSRRDGNWTLSNYNDSDILLLLLLIMPYCHSYPYYFIIVGCL